MSLTPSVTTVNRGIGAFNFELMLLPPRHCERSEAIHAPAQRKNGLLRFARNDDYKDRVLSLEQTQLLSAAIRLDEMIGRQFQAALVEAELFAGDFEPPPDHPGHRAGALHPRTPLRVVIATAAHVADQGEDVTVTVGI